VQNIRQLEAALHREWWQLSHKDIRRLTGGLRRRVEAVIQARGGYTNLNPIEHIWDMLSRCIQSREPHVQNIRQLEAVLYREWWQLSHKDIRHLTGGMRRRVDAVVQTRGDYTRY
jgi:ABC-type Mn2+/Zn2+ transport system ATPase subunit